MAAPRTVLRREARRFPEGSLPELPDIEAGRGAFDHPLFPVVWPPGGKP